MNIKYKPIALYILENYIDDIMTESGFKRRSNALVYSRTIGTTKQKLEMVCYSHPPYYAGSLLHIYPYMSVYFPEINKTAENMISNEGTMTIQQTIRQPIQAKAFGTTPWILMTDAKEEVDAVAEKIRIYMKQYTIPLLDDLKTIDGYIDKYERQEGNKTISLSPEYWFYVASAYAIKGEYAKGLEVLDNRFKGPAIRKYHARAFEYLKMKLGEI